MMFNTLKPVYLNKRKGDEEPGSVREAIEQELGGDEEDAELHGFEPSPDFDPDAPPADDDKDGQDDDDKDGEGEGEGDGEGDGQDQDKDKEGDGQDQEDLIPLDDSGQKKGEGEGEGETDPELYTEPKGLSKESSERFQKLVNSDKKKTAELEELKPQMQKLQQDVKVFSDVISSFDARPEQLDEMARFSRSLASGTPEGLEYAWNQIETYRNLVGKMLGKPVGGEEHAYAQHADLKAAVDQMEMTEKYANEVAAARAKENLSQQNQQRQQQTQQQQQQRQQTNQYVSNALTQLESSWTQDERYSQPRFAGPDGQPVSMQQLVAAYTQHVTQQAMRGAIPPAQIPISVQQYGNQLMNKLNAQGAGGGGRQRQPMRGDTGGGGRSQPEPKTTYDAITIGLGMGD